MARVSQQNAISVERLAASSQNPVLPAVVGMRAWAQKGPAGRSPRCCQVEPSLPPAAQSGMLPGKALPFPLGRTLLAYDKVLVVN